MVQHTSYPSYRHWTGLRRCYCPALQLDADPVPREQTGWVDPWSDSGLIPLGVFCFPEEIHPYWVQRLCRAALTNRCASRSLQIQRRLPSSLPCHNINYTPRYWRVYIQWALRGSGRSNMFCNSILAQCGHIETSFLITDRVSLQRPSLHCR